MGNGIGLDDTAAFPDVSVPFTRPPDKLPARGPAPGLGGGPLGAESEPTHGLCPWDAKPDAILGNDAAWMGGGAGGACTGRRIGAAATGGGLATTAAPGN